MRHEFVSNLIDNNNRFSSSNSFTIFLMEMLNLIETTKKLVKRKNEPYILANIISINLNSIS